MKSGKNYSSCPGRWKNQGVPIVKGRQNLPPGWNRVNWSKAELPQVGYFFRTQFPSLGILEIKKNWDHPVYNFLNWYDKSGLSFFDFQLFTNKKFPGKEIECSNSALPKICTPSYGMPIMHFEKSLELSTKKTCFKADPKEILILI